MLTGGARDEGIILLLYRRKYWKPYKYSLRKYKSVQDCQEVILATRLSKFLSKEHKSPSFAKRLKDCLAKSSDETPELLVQPLSHQQRGLWVMFAWSWETTNSVITADKVSWVINNFSTAKSPASNGILSLMLQIQQATQERVVQSLVEIYRRCISLGYGPHSWRHAY